MGRQINFEVHVSQKGRWEIHARHEDANAATEEAKTLDILPSVDEVKVVRDSYDPDTGDSVESIVYRSPKGKKEQAAYRLSEAKKYRNARDNRSDGSELDFTMFGKPRKRENKKSEGKEQTFTTTLIKILLIILFGVTIAGLLAFGSIVFLRDTSLSNNVQTNIVFVIFVVTFVVSTFVMALNFLKKENLSGSPRPEKLRRPAPRPKPIEPNKKPAKRTPAKDPEISSFDAGVPGAPPSVEALASEADTIPMPELPSLNLPGEIEHPEPVDHEIPAVPVEPELELEPEPDPEPVEMPEIPPIVQPRLPPHAETQRLALMKFLSDGLEKMNADTSRFDSFNKFGINLFLAGAIEALGHKTMLDIRSASIILSETVTLIGFRKTEAIKFADNYEDYLLADSRYMQMFQAGRNAMNMNLDDDPDSVKYLEQALGEWNRPKPKEENAGPVTVLFTDIAGSTAMTQELGDAVAQQIVRAHNRVVREALTDFGGKEIKHTGDGIMASFSNVSSAVEAAICMQKNVASHTQNNPDLPLHVKIGINAGEPIAEDNDLFGSTVQMAARIVDKASKNEIFVSEIVRGICEGKNFQFNSRGEFDMKGFDQPPTLYEVLWKDI